MAEEKAKPFSFQLRERLSVVERRDWELWILALVTVAILATGLFFVLLPAVFMGQRTIQIKANLSPQLMLGLVLLVLLLIAYLVHKQIQLRAMRLRSIIEAWNFEVAHVQMLIDPLTQVFNRSSLEEILAKEIKRVQRKQSTLVFLYIDVNDFKMVNSRFGHLSGDLVLAEVGGMLKQAVRGSDYVVRMGGDEFLAALVDTDEKGGEIVKARLRERIDEWNQNSPLPGFSLSLSVGIQPFDASLTFDQVMAEADAKMYAEKKTRR
ncbi:MAG: GGDEF domain-containing protein [Acidobacteria bacterium]|nr:GGDEF domain-containing protein [Acidobacteriota bacterium]